MWMESQLLKGTLVSYGQELLTALKEEQGLDQVGYALQGLSRNDLQQAHPRPRDPLLQDPGKRSKFIRFLARKADVLYKTWDTLPHTLTTDEENEELCAVMPPLESFMSVPAAERKKYFFETLKKGDIVVGHISGKQENGFFVTLLCMDGGLRREIHDLAVKAFCPLNQMQTFSAHESPFDIFQSKDLVRGVVISCSSESERIILSMKSDALPADQQHLMKLGLITEDDIPSHHKRLLSTHGRSFQEVLERTMGFNNPATATHLCSVLGIPSWKQASLMKGLQMKEYPREEYAVALRKAQSSKWAYKSLKDGVMHFKAGNHTEAFVCLNKALQIDPENVEALVARGALFANNSNLRRALEDFEAALALNPNHPNARKYMSETLVALGRYYEEKNDLEGAVKTYKKAVKVNLSNVDARDALMAAEVRDHRKKDSDTRSLSSQASALADIHADVNKSKDTREKLRLLLREDEKKKNKKHRHRSSSSSSASSSSSSAASSRSSSSSGYGRRHSRKRSSRKHRKGEGEEKHRSSKKKKSKESRGRSSEKAEPPVAAPAAALDEEDDSYWKMAGEVRGSSAVHASSSAVQPSASSSNSKAGCRSMSPLSKALAQRLYEAEEELGVHKAAFARQEAVAGRSEPSPKVTFINRPGEMQAAPRLFNVAGNDAGSSAYEKKEPEFKSGDGFRMESVVRRPDAAPPPGERKSIEFKWKAVKKPLQQTEADSHEEGSVTSDDEKRDAEKKEEKATEDDKAASSHEEGSIRSESDREEKRKKRRDYSSSQSSSGGRREEVKDKHRRKIRRSRADSESFSSSGRSKSPRRRRRRSASEDYSSDRSSLASRGRRRRARSGHSSDSSRSHRRYSSEDSRDGRGGHRRDDSYSSDSSHRRHSPSRRGGRGGYRPYYHQNRGGYYNNRRYNNYRGGYQNNRYFRGGRGGRRPYRPYYNRGSPRYYNNSGGYSNRHSGRDRRSGSEGHDDRSGSFCPPWKRRNPIVSRAPDAEELKRLKEAAAQRNLEKEEAGGSKITKATIIRNWLDDADSRSPPRGSASPKGGVARSVEPLTAPSQPPLPPVAPRVQQQPPPPGDD